MSPDQQDSLPAGWTRVRFGDVVRNKNLTTKDPQKDGLDRIVGLTHLDSESLPVVRWDLLEGETSFSRTFTAGDVLFGKRRAYQRKVGVPNFAGICSGDILVFESKSPSLLQEFLPYIVQSDAFFRHALGTSAGSLSPRTNWTQLARFEFALPPIEEQKRIADIADSIDSALLALHLASSKALELRQSILSELFRDYDQSTKVCALEDVVSINPESRGRDSDGATFRYIDIASVSADRGIDVASLTVQSSDTAPSRAQRIVRRGDILISTVRPSLRAVARVEGDLDGEVASTGFAVLRVVSGADEELLWGIVRSEEFVQHLISRSTGSNYPAVNASDVGSFRFPLPSLDEQRRIAGLLASIDFQVQSLSVCIASARELRSAALRELLCSSS
jgi:type I restriction enzyme S subunit